MEYRGEKLPIDFIIVFDGRGHEVIPNSIQLVAGRTGQQQPTEESQRGLWGRPIPRYCRGAWRPSDALSRLYDLNMVRAVVVNHPSEWSFSEYNEIQEPCSRSALIDYEKLQNLLGISSYELKQSHRSWVEESLASRANGRQHQWTESIAVGGKRFVEELKTRIGIKARGRLPGKGDGAYELREPQSSCGLSSDPQNDALRPENTHFGG